MRIFDIEIFSDNFMGASLQTIPDLKYSFLEGKSRAGADTGIVTHRDTWLCVSTDYVFSIKPDYWQRSFINPGVPESPVL